MSSDIGSYEAKTRLPQILREVAEGKEYTITNRGKAVADIIPSRQSVERRTSNAINAILNMKKTSVDSDELKRLVEQGRK